MATAQTSLRALSAGIGIVVILAPIIFLALSSRREKGRTIGTGIQFRRLPGIILIALALMIVGALLWKPLPFSLSPNDELLLCWIGLIIYLPAIALYLWGFRSLGRNFGVSSVGGADLNPNHILVRSGPFRFIRHPMYLAVFLAAIGAFLVFLTWAMLIFLPMTLVVIPRAWQEEKLLKNAFGQEWEEYARQVPMWIPRLFKNKSSDRM